MERDNDETARVVIGLSRSVDKSEPHLPERRVGLYVTHQWATPTEVGKSENQLKKSN